MASPMGGVVVDVRASRGDAVLAGDALMVISAMKMEAVVTAPCAGTVARVLPLQPGDSVAQDQVVAVIAPGDVAGGLEPAPRGHVAAAARRRRRAAGHRRRPLRPGLRPTPASCASATAAS